MCFHQLDQMSHVDESFIKLQCFAQISKVDFKYMQYSNIFFFFFRSFVIDDSRHENLKPNVRYCFLPKTLYITGVLTRNKNNKLYCQIEICFEDIFIAHHFLKQHSLYWLENVLFSKVIRIISVEYPFGNLRRLKWGAIKINHQPLHATIVPLYV